MTTESFAGIWDVLERYGLCDSIGSAEYRRVLCEWINAGRPMPCAQFIIERANFIGNATTHELGGEG